MLPSRFRLRRYRLARAERLPRQVRLAMLLAAIGALHASRPATAEPVVMTDVEADTITAGGVGEVAHALSGFEPAYDTLAGITAGYTDTQRGDAYDPGANASLERQRGYAIGTLSAVEDMRPGTTREAAQGLRGQPMSYAPGASVPSASGLSDSVLYGK